MKHGCRIQAYKMLSIYMTAVRVLSILYQSPTKQPPPVIPMKEESIFASIIAQMLPSSAWQ